MSACDDLVGFADGEMEPGRGTAFRAHLPTCEACRRGLIEALQLGAQLSTLRPPPAALRALIAEGRKHDEAMTRARRTTFAEVASVADALAANDAGIAWLRTNLARLLDALTAALDDAEQLRQLNRTWVAARDAWEACTISDPKFARISSAVVKSERALRATVDEPDTGNSPAAVEVAQTKLIDLIAATPIGDGPTPGWQERVHAAADEVDKERAAAPDPEPGLGSPDEFHAAWAAEQRKEKP